MLMKWLFLLMASVGGGYAAFGPILGHGGMCLIGG